jgi:Txe/YoeB family toxin of Txe-Axe toxin-antitoxin module
MNGQRSLDTRASQYHESQPPKQINKKQKHIFFSKKHPKLQQKTKEMEKKKRKLILKLEDQICRSNIQTTGNLEKTTGKMEGNYKKKLHKRISWNERIQFEISIAYQMISMLRVCACVCVSIINNKIKNPERDIV